LIIQVFPWAITFSNGLLVRTAADAASRASVPIAIHLDHCQDEELVRLAAETLPFDSIMIDMSHHEKAENLSKTAELVEFCHARGIATEAEPGRIEGGEDGVMDTAEMEGLLTTPEEVDEFIATGVDFLAPAFGNIHGEYGLQGPKLDFDRYLSPVSSSTSQTPSPPTSKLNKNDTASPPSANKQPEESV
jgi:fructose-bisphosphate aldolase, class II